MEGVLVPEIWIAVAEKTGIPGLRLTTRDIPDYDVLMKGRLKLLAENGLGIQEIQEVIGTQLRMIGQFNSCRTGLHTANDHAVIMRIGKPHFTLTNKSLN